MHTPKGSRFKLLWWKQSSVELYLPSEHDSIRVLKDFFSFPLSKPKGSNKKEQRFGHVHSVREPVRCRRPFGDEAHCRTAEHPVRDLLYAAYCTSQVKPIITSPLMPRTADHRKWSPSLLRLWAPLHYRFSHSINEFLLLLHPRVRHFFVIEMHQWLRRALRLCWHSISSGLFDFRI
jgi:hypothetical protein